MFVDYYAVLNVDEGATLNQIKSAFKKQALKWHPDRNLHIDTTKRMQELNEAYLILKDEEARGRYNLEYERFLRHRNQKSNTYPGFQPKANGDSYENSEFEINDDVLLRWMTNARKQAVDLAQETIKDFKGMVSIGVEEAAKSAGTQLFYQILAGIIMLLLLGIVQTCKN